MKGILDDTDFGRACKELHNWAKVHRQRDEIIQRAAAAGVGQRHICEITGVARTTIARILQEKGDG